MPYIIIYDQNKKKYIKRHIPFNTINMDYMMKKKWGVRGKEIGSGSEAK